MRAPLSLLFFSALAGTMTVIAAPNDLTKSFDSPDGRFALTITMPDKKAEWATLQVVEQASRKVVAELGNEYPSIMSEIKVAWSPDSKRLAYRTAGQREWSTSVYFWDGSAFVQVELPEELPSPDINTRKSDEAGGVKNYGGGEEPVRWLKSGDLELRSEQRLMARESSRSYTGTVTFTIGFDAQQRASVKTVSKSKTRVE
jgi:hypothetical protein